MLASSIRFTQASQALGTPEYMSPEQAMGRDADHRSDLYAFGIMIYQLLLGQTPFHADTPQATLMAHVHQALPLPSVLNPDIEPRLEATLLKCLAKDPDDRFQSAKDMVQAFMVATGQARAAGADELGATRVLGTAELQIAEETDAPTAVTAPITPEARAGRTEAMREVEEEEPPTPSPKRRWLMVGGGVAVAALVAVVIGVVAFTGGGADATPTPTTPQATTAAAAVTSPVPDPTAEAAAAAATATATAQEAADVLRKASETPETTFAAGAGPAPTPVVIVLVATPVPPQEPPTPASPATLAEALVKLQEMMGRAKGAVTKGRELTPNGEVHTQFKTREQLGSIVKGFFRRESLRSQVFDAEELYKALDLMEEEQDLEEIILGIALQQVYALFDDESEVVYVITDSTDVGAAEELAYASAYMGGLQQNLYNIGGMRQFARKGSADEFRAVTALIGGDVAAVGTAYQGSFTAAQMEELRKPLAENRLLTAPRIVVEAAIFPQREGADFVSALYGKDDLGWEGVNKAYARPPVSTEQVLHPEKYFAGEEPEQTTLPNIANGLGKGWVQGGANTMGEFLIRAYLQEHLDSIQASEAAGGRAGDRYSLLSGPEGQRLLLIAIRFDSFLDSVEFFDTYQVFVGIKTEGPNVRSERLGDTGRKWITPDQTIFLGQVGDTILVIIGEDEQTVGDGLDLLFEALESTTP